jgi:hypothetical protein
MGIAEMLYVMGGPPPGMRVAVDLVVEVLDTSADEPVKR